MHQDHFSGSGLELLSNQLTTLLPPALIIQSESAVVQVLCLLSGKLNSSLNRSLSGSTGPAPTNISRPANQSRPRRSTVYANAEPVSSTTSRRSLSAQARKPSEVERVKVIRSTPLKRAETTPLQVTPAKRVMERTASIPIVAAVRPQSGLKTKSKPEALVPPTPSGGVKGVPRGDGKGRQ